jgi:carbon-monoxide dehydrogenase large subunit
MVHAAFLRSPHPHARILGIDAKNAATSPGVVAIRTGSDLNLRSKLMQVGETTEASAIDIEVLPSGKARMVGDPLAVVVAQDRYLAEDAMELIDVTYEPLSPVLDADVARASTDTLVHENLGSNVFSTAEGGYGDWDEAVASSDVVVRETFRQARCSPFPLEGRALVADWDPADAKLTVWSSSQWPHMFRQHLSDLLNIPLDHVRVVTQDVGGAFGLKANTFREDIAIALLAVELGRPVKWVEDRRENLMASAHARDHSIDLEIALKNDGVILGLRARIVDDMGAYGLYPWSPDSWGKLLAVSLPLPYKVPNYQWEVVTVVTNKAPESAYRAPGNAAGAWARESLLDIAARQLSLDPIDLRRRNLIARQDLPFSPLGGGAPIDAVTTEEALEQAAALIGYDDFRQEQQKALAEGRYLGVGFGIYIKAAGRPKSPATVGLSETGLESATVRMSATGAVQAFVGACSGGQGYETTFAQLVADEMGVPVDAVQIQMGDTDFPAESSGTWGSRSTVVVGATLVGAARDVSTQMIAVAAKMMEAPQEEVALEGGFFIAERAPSERLSVLDVARAAWEDSSLAPSTLGTGLSSTRHYEIPGPTYSNGCHAAVVEVDTETGKVSVLRYVAVEDCGPLINPMIANGQIRGAIAQAYGSVFLEEIVYSEDGLPLTTTLLDYLIPDAASMGDVIIKHLETPAPGSGRFKSLGEGPLVASAPAFACAVADALSPFDARLTRLPLKPDRLIEATGGD